MSTDNCVQTPTTRYLPLDLSLANASPLCCMAPSCSLCLPRNCDKILKDEKKLLISRQICGKGVSRHQETHPLPGSRGQKQGALHGRERLPSLARIDAPNKPSLSFITRIQLNCSARPLFLTFPHGVLAAPAAVVVRKVQLRLWTRKLSPGLDISAHPTLGWRQLLDIVRVGSHEQRGQGSCRRKQMST